MLDKKLRTNSDQADVRTNVIIAPAKSDKRIIVMKVSFATLACLDDLKVTIGKLPLIN